MDFFFTDLTSIGRGSKQEVISEVFYFYGGGGVRQIFKQLPKLQYEHVNPKLHLKFGTIDPRPPTV